MKKAPSSANRARVQRAEEGLGAAEECIGPIVPGLSLFVVTRGQISMIDVVRHVLACLGPSRVSIWTWTVAHYEKEVMLDLMRSGAVSAGVLIVDADIRRKTDAGSRDGRLGDEEAAGVQIVRQWQRAFGADSVRLVKNHAKIATVEGGGMRVLIRGSMNLNYNPRFEQFDLTEGGPEFDLVKSIEQGLEALEMHAPASEVARVNGVGVHTFEGSEGFEGVALWRP